MGNNSIDILVEKVSAGDSEAFKELCERKYKDIYFQAYRLVNNHHDAEDVTQNVILKIYRNIAGLQNTYAFTAWLYRMVTNECNNLLRKRMMRKEDMIYDEESDLRSENNREIIPEKHMEESEFEKYVIQLIGKLPRERQRCFYLFYYEGLKYREIAEATGLNMNTIASNIKRAKEMIKREIEQNTDYVITYEDEEQENE